MSADSMAVKTAAQANDEKVIAALADRLRCASYFPVPRDEAVLQRMVRALRADPTTLRTRQCGLIIPDHSDELSEWEPLVRSGAFGPSSAVSIEPAAPAVAMFMPTRVPVPLLVRAIRVMCEYSATLDTLDVGQYAMAPGAVALLCTALSGMDQRRSSGVDAAGATTGGLRSLTLDGEGGYVDGGRSGAWHVAQYVRTNASLRRLSLRESELASAADVAELCDALLARRDALGATLDSLDVSHTPVFPGLYDESTAAEDVEDYRRALARIAAFSARNGATATTTADGQRRYVPAALQSLALNNCGSAPLDALTAMRGVDRKDDNGMPVDGLSGLSATWRDGWTTECVDFVSAWVSSADCTLRALVAPGSPYRWLARTAVSPTFASVVSRCTLFANTSLTELDVDDYRPLTNAEFVALLSAVRTHPALRRFRVGTTCALGHEIWRAIDSADSVFAKALTVDFRGRWCVPLLCELGILSDDDWTLSASARVMAVAELMAFGADHLEELLVTGLQRLVNGTSVAVAQRWLRDGTRHADTGNLVRRETMPSPAACTGTAATPNRDPAHPLPSAAGSCPLPAVVPVVDSTSATGVVAAASIAARLSAAPEAARFSSLKRLTIECDIAALTALRTALAPPSGLFSRSLEELTLEDMRIPAVQQSADNPWLGVGVLPHPTETAVAWASTGRRSFSDAVVALLCDGLRHNTTLTALSVMDWRLRDEVVTKGLLPLLVVPGRHGWRWRRSRVPRVIVRPNRTLRRVALEGAHFTDASAFALETLLQKANAHGLRELHIMDGTCAFGANAVHAIAVAMAALDESGGACVTVDLSRGDDPHGRGAAHSPHELVRELSAKIRPRAQLARRQWARVAVVMASYRAICNGLANSVMPLLPLITALAAL